MSLKAFHIVFISISTVVSAVFALWCVREITHTPEPFTVGGAIGASLATVGLLVYAALFLKRARTIDLL